MMATDGSVESSGSLGKETSTNRARYDFSEVCKRNGMQHNCFISDISRESHDIKPVVDEGSESKSLLERGPAGTVTGVMPGPEMDTQAQTKDSQTIFAKPLSPSLRSRHLKRPANLINCLHKAKKPSPSNDSYFTIGFSARQRNPASIGLSLRSRPEASSKEVGGSLSPKTRNQCISLRRPHLPSQREGVSPRSIRSQGISCPDPSRCSSSSMGVLCMEKHPSGSKCMSCGGESANSPQPASPPSFPCLESPSSPPDSFQTSNGRVLDNSLSRKRSLDTAFLHEEETPARRRTHRSPSAGAGMANNSITSHSKVAADIALVLGAHHQNGKVNGVLHKMSEVVGRLNGCSKTGHHPPVHSAHISGKPRDTSELSTSLTALSSSIGLSGSNNSLSQARQLLNSDSSLHSTLESKSSVASISSSLSVIRQQQDHNSTQGIPSLSKSGSKSAGERTKMNHNSKESSPTKCTSSSSSQCSTVPKLRQRTLSGSNIKKSLPASISSSSLLVAPSSDTITSATFTNAASKLKLTSIPSCSISSSVSSVSSSPSSKSPFDLSSSAGPFSSLLLEPSSPASPASSSSSSTSQQPSQKEVKADVCKWRGCSFESNTGDLLEHLRQHTELQISQKKYACLWTGCKVFDKPSWSGSWLERHVVTHGGHRPFRCILDHCGQRFHSQMALERHVNSHFKAGLAAAGGPQAGGGRGGRGRPEDQGSRAAQKRRRQLQLKRKSMQSVKKLDVFDTETMAHLKQEMVQMADQAHLDMSGKLLSATFQGKVVGRRTAKDGTSECLVEFTPADVLLPQWCPEKAASQVSEVTIPLHKLPQDTVANLHDSLYCRHRFRKGRRK